MNQFSYQQYNPYQQRQSQVNGINWVQGIEGAKAFQLMPNSNVILMDSENDNTFYIKISDNIGMCSLRVFTFTEVSAPTTKDMSQYITRDELNDILNNRLRGNNNVKQSVQSTNSTNAK